MTKLRILLTGGGSGGHIYPLSAVANKIREDTKENGIELDARYFGQPESYKSYLETQGIKITSMISSKWRQYPSALNFLEPFKLILGIIQGLWKIFWFMPDVVFSKGGPGALAVVLASRWYRIPVVIHESDAVAGRTNIICGKKAEIVELTFPEARQYFGGRAELHVVGTPVRESILTTESRAGSRASLGLNDEKPVLLFIGGSQGAQKMNYFILENGQTLLQNFEIIHQVGKANYVGFKAEYDFVSKNWPVEIRKNYVLVPYFDDAQLGSAMNAADLIISRAGSGAISEISAMAKPAILVPIADSANNHQRENAYAYAKTGAANVIEEENLLPNLFINEVHKLLSAPANLERMSQAARTFYKPNAAELIAKDILTVSGINAVNS